MHDRQPGAPGQYKMTISATELQNFLAGETCTVALTRDDQPLAEGTPYNKASVLPDDLAAQICPSVTDPTPADAFRGVMAQRWAPTLMAASWEGSGPYTQTISAEGILSTDKPHIGPVYSNDYLEVAVAQKEAWSMVSRAYTSDGAVTFICFEEKPEVDIPIQLEVNR